jgi:hypothetical protein
MAVALTACSKDRAETELQRAIQAHDAPAVRRLLAGASLGSSLADPGGPYELALWNLAPGDAATIEVLRLVIAAEEARAASREESGSATARPRPADATFRQGGESRSDLAAVEIAARRWSPEGVAVLIDHGLTIRGEAVNDALVSASANGCVLVIRLLLDAGADVNGMDEHDDAPLAMARRVRSADVAAYLLGRGAREPRPSPQARAWKQRIEDLLGRIFVGDTSGMPSSQPPADDVWMEGADVLGHAAGKVVIEAAAQPGALTDAIRRGSVLKLDGTRAELHVVTMAGGAVTGTAVHVVELRDGSWRPAPAPGGVTPGP